MLKEFKPRQIPPLSRDAIGQLFRKGDFHNAVKQCKKAQYPLEDFQNEIESGVHKLMVSHRPGEALSFIYQYGVSSQHDIRRLLLTTFDINDYHGFLKNALRFKMLAGFEDQIELAIDNLREKGRTDEAQAWQKKFDALKD